MSIPELEQVLRSVNPHGYNATGDYRDAHGIFNALHIGWCHRAVALT
jgi:hypothetical protein